MLNFVQTTPTPPPTKGVTRQLGNRSMMPLTMPVQALIEPLLPPQVGSEVPVEQMSTSSSGGVRKSSVERRLPWR